MSNHTAKLDSNQSPHQSSPRYECLKPMRIGSSLQASSLGVGQPLRQHDVHDSMFESFYLKHTGTYYNAESAHLRATSSPRDFMLKYVQRIQHERLRAAPVMDIGSVARVENEMKVAFLINNSNLEWIAKGQDGGAC